MIRFFYKGHEFIIQSYLKDDFANICKINGDSFKICFFNETVSTSGKEDKFWQSVKSLIDVKEIKSVIDHKILTKSHI